ncbi:MAG TPA: cupin domain-containing protein [Pyrinomonadaceae bacterium]|nr:cupin domain-containing protein [Pyrinomonadaceae bacterium]
MKDGSINSLEKLLEPCPPEEFLHSTWGKAHRYIQGRRGKFARLLPWDQLNEILMQHRLDFPRLRLALDGKSLPASSYLKHTRNARQTTVIPRLLSDELTKQLREGATLVLDAVDELFRPLRELAEGLEYFFHEHVQVNAYAGWQTSRGFDLHFDDHDVFILQVAGRKRWKVYGMTKPYPLAQDRNLIEKPTAGPIWEGMLEDGDLLYMPRGWWHLAEPLAEPTLHLTVGVHNRTGMDFLRWMVERVGKKSASFRQDLPRFSSASDQQAHMNQLRTELLTGWDESLLKSYLDNYDAMAEPRPCVGLPWSVIDKSLIPSKDALVRLTAPRPINYVVEDAVLKFSCNKKLWRVAAETHSIFHRLEDKCVCSVAELCASVSGKIDEQAVCAFLGEMIFHGLIAVVESHS